MSQASQGKGSFADTVAAATRTAIKSHPNDALDRSKRWTEQARAWATGEGRALTTAYGEALVVGAVFAVEACGGERTVAAVRDRLRDRFPHIKAAGR